MSFTVASFANAKTATVSGLMFSPRDSSGLRGSPTGSAHVLHRQCRLGWAARACEVAGL